MARLLQDALLRLPPNEARQYFSNWAADNRARLALDARTDLYGGNGGPAQIGISYEPALGPLSIREYPGLRPHWLIFGGETGPKPRPMQLEWAENIKRECEEFGVAFFMKQMSARTPAKAAELIPANLLLRQFPTEDLCK